MFYRSDDISPEILIIMMTGFWMCCVPINSMYRSGFTDLGGVKSDTLIDAWGLNGKGWGHILLRLTSRCPTPQ